jgi:hypothetical protein
MEKILLAMEGNQQHTYAVDFACYLAKLTGSRLIGAFLEGDTEGRGTRPALREPITVEEYMTEGKVEDPMDREVRRFREACVCRDVPARVHRDKGLPLTEILLESRFSDLVVLDPETSAGEIDKQFPGRFVREVLVSAECPVMIAPYSFSALDTVYFAYNGTASSVFAIKQFTYLFPEFRNKKAVLVSVRKGDGVAIEEQFKMKEWFSAYYQAPEFMLLTGDASDELFGFLLEKKDAVVVLGAYGRGTMSRFFKPSQAGLLMKTVNMAIFIAHR